jgi:hypothetical protein
MNRGFRHGAGQWTARLEPNLLAFCRQLASARTMRSGFAKPAFSAAGNAHKWRLVRQNNLAAKYIGAVMAPARPFNWLAATGAYFFTRPGYCRCISSCCSACFICSRLAVLFSGDGPTTCVRDGSVSHVWVPGGRPRSLRRLRSHLFIGGSFGFRQVNMRLFAVDADLWFLFGFLLLIGPTISGPHFIWFRFAVIAATGRTTGTGDRGCVAASR